MSEHQPRLISHRAADDLSYIRSAMERSSAFTAVPGRGGVVAGVIGLVAATAAARQPLGDRWLATWLLAASLAVVVELAAVTWKARRAGIVLSGTNARRFALGIAAPLVAGGALTHALWVVREFSVMAPAWLLLYGVGVLTGGMFSVPVVRTLGVCFMAVGLAASLTPADWGNAWLGLGFGGLHVGFGAYIARYHGG
ncbi:MAG: hypothetical protein AB7G23_10180 [Vicinamibacterales bacterium]